jgi:hypothetical protein
MTSPYETAARVLKAQKLMRAAEQLHAEVGFDGPASGMVERMNAAQRAVLASVAGVKTPSATTWDVVIRALKNNEAQPDPFAGLAR